MKTYIFDFDMTLTKVHVYNEYFIKKNKNIIEDKYIFRNIILEKFDSFVKNQLHNNNKIIICSFNEKKIIKHCLKNILDEKIIKKISIITPKTYAMSINEVSTKKFQGINIKQVFVKSILEINNIPKDIYFYDDDITNIFDVKKLRVNCYHVTNDSDFNVLLS